MVKIILVSCRLYTVWSSLPLWPHFLLLFTLVIVFKSHWLPCCSLNIPDMFSFQELFSISSDPDVCSFPRYNVLLSHFLQFFAQNHPISPWVVQISNLKKCFFFILLAMVGLHCCKWAFSSCSWRGCSLVAVGRLLIVVFLVAELGLQGAGASVVVAYGPSCLAACGILLESCGPGIKPVCPALAGRFLYYWTTRGVQSLF